LTRRLLLLAAALAALVLTIDAQPTARITAPAEGSYLTGPVRFTIAFEPSTLAANVRVVRWFADGQQVCAAEASPFSCDWDAGNRIEEHVIRAVAVLKQGSSIVANVRTKAVEFAETVDVDVVQVTAVVTDTAGKFVTGLKASDFRVLENDKPQRLTTFQVEDIPLELVAAIDVSSSMTDALPGVKRHATRFLSQLRDGDQVTVLGFNDSIFTLARRSTDRAVRERAVARLAPFGGTALYDVIIHAFDLLGRQAGRRSLLVFSDGEDQSSRASMQAVVQRAESSDATVYVIGQGRALRAPALQQLMRQLAEGSGGRAFFSDNDARLETIFQDILEDLRHQYLLAYPAPDDARDGQWHRIRVEVPGRGYSVRARLGYRIAKPDSK
jgi:Ca-activated chloride channel family protein